MIIVGLGIGLTVQSLMYITLVNQNQALQEELDEKNEDLEDLNSILNNIEDSTELGLYFMQNIEFDTNYGQDGWTYWIKIPFDTYFNYRLYNDHSVSRTSYQALANSAEDFCEENDVQFIAETVRKCCVNQNDDEEVANALLNFVQDKGEFEPSLHYISEEDDMPKYPIETICEGGGDCEDLTILYVSLLESLGFDTILIVIPGHCFAGVALDSAPTWGDGWFLTYEGTDYYTCETTTEGWRVGDLPDSSQVDSFYLAEVIC